MQGPAGRAWGPSFGRGDTGNGASEDDDDINRELIALLRRNLASGVPALASKGARRSLQDDLAQFRPHSAPKKRNGASKKKAAAPPEVPADAGGLDRPPEGFSLPARELPARPAEKQAPPNGQKAKQSATPPVSRKPVVPRTSGRAQSAPKERGRKDDAKEKENAPQPGADGETDAEDAAAKAAKQAEVRHSSLAPPLSPPASDSAPAASAQRPPPPSPACCRCSPIQVESIQHRGPRPFPLMSSSA